MAIVEFNSESSVSPLDDDTTAVLTLVGGKVRTYLKGTYHIPCTSLRTKLSTLNWLNVVSYEVIE